MREEITHPYRSEGAVYMSMPGYDFVSGKMALMVDRGFLLVSSRFHCIPWPRAKAQAQAANSRNILQKYETRKV